jgi:hypothetical protein
MRSFYSSSPFHKCYCDPRGRSSIHRKHTLTGIDGAHTNISATPSQDKRKEAEAIGFTAGDRDKGPGAMCSTADPWKFGGSLVGFF